METYQIGGREGLDGVGVGGEKEHTENKYQNGKCKSNNKNNYINCERSKHPNQKTEICRLN